MDDAYVTVGRLTKPHGIRGVLKLASFTELPEDIFTYASLFIGDAKKTIAITKKSQASPDAFLVDVSGVETRNQAEALSGTDVFARRSDLPQVDNDTFYFVDLIGCVVVDYQKSTNELGTVINVDAFGAQANLEIVDALGRKFYTPFTKKAVISVDIQHKKIEVDSALLIAQKQPASGKESDETPEDEQ